MTEPSKVCSQRAPTAATAVNHATPADTPRSCTPGGRTRACARAWSGQLVVTAPVAGPRPEPIGTVTTVHLVVDPAHGLYGATVDEVAAHRKAQELGYVVVALPASADYRRPAEGQADGL